MNVTMKPPRDLLRRHYAAMSVIRDIHPKDRPRVLCYVVGWLSDPEIDEAVRLAEAERRPLARVA